jgi:hypothetical protein
MPEVVTRMPIPEEYAAMGVRRYGAHGLSFESIVYQLEPNVPEKLVCFSPSKQPQPCAIPKSPRPRNSWIECSAGCCRVVRARCLF